MHNDATNLQKVYALKETIGALLLCNPESIDEEFMQTLNEIAALSNKLERNVISRRLRTLETDFLPEEG